MKLSGVLLSHQKVTTHCFRRSGAHILAFYQSNGVSWNLSLVRSYCGWTALSEKDMITKYLVHTARELEDESTECFNPYRRNRNVVLNLVGKTNTIY